MKGLSTLVILATLYISISNALPHNDLAARSFSDATSDPLTSSVSSTTTQGVFGGKYGPGPVRLPTTTSTQGVYGGHFGPGPVRLPTSTSTQGVYGGHFSPGPVKLPSTTSISTLNFGPGPVKLPPTSTSS